MSKIFRAAAPLTSRIAPVLGAVLVLVGLIASSQLHLAQVTAGSTVTTDKNDYAPGETVAISGSGWIPGQPVALHIDESDSDLPWGSSATPDAAGNISNSDFVIQTNDIGVLFTLTATQGSVTATTQFTDVVAAGTAPNGDPGGFEIEGNVVATAGGGHTDWVANGVGTTGLLNSVTGDPLDSTVTFRRLDAYSGTDDVFAGSHKFDDNPNTYTWKTASAASKDDLNNVYVHISKDGAGDRWITASADRLSNNGTAFVDFELTQANLTQVTDVGCSSAPCGHFVTNPAGAVSGDPLFATGGRTPNDLLITAQYNSGGSLATAIVYQWKLVSGTYQWVDITSSIAVNTAFVATNTVDGVSVPYGAFGATTYSKNQFVEMSIDATQLIKVNVDPCSGIEIHSVFVRTKTSTSASAVLDDFVTPISLSFSAGFTASLTQSAVSCFGGSNGSVTATINGGTTPYSVTLGATTQTVLTDAGSTTFTGLSAGTKTVHVVATGGCTKDVTIDVTQPASAVGSSITSQTNVGCFGGSTGSVTVAGSGGTPSYTYSIDGTNFGVSGTFNNLAAGSYTVTVKDANGCTTTQPVTITQTASTVSASISSQTNVACFGGSTGSVTVSASGGTSPYTFSKDGVTFGASGTFSNLAAGSYTITVKDANGCSTTQPVTIRQPAAALSSSISSQTNVACFGGSTGNVTVAGSGGTGPYTFSKDGVNFGGSGTFGSLAAGSYTITVKDAVGCTTTRGVTITQPASALGASISSQTNVGCFGSSTGGVTVAGSGGTSPYTYAIDGVTFGNSSTFSNLAGGSYTITVKDANGCATTQPVTITQPASALGSSISSQTNVACFGGSTGSVTVAGSGGTASYTYAIDGATFGNSGAFSNLAAGSYTVTVKDANGCTTTQPATITQPAAALSSSISSQTNVACFGSSTGSVTVAGSGATAPYTYSIDGTNFGNSGTFSNLAAGSYTITVKDANGCTTTQSVTITQPASGLTASALATNPACSTGTGSITVTASGGTGTLSYSIDGTNSQASNVFNGLASGSYTITVKDANGCTTAAGATVTIPTPVTASSTKADPLCDGQLGSMTATFSGGTPGYECSLDNGSFAPCTSPATFNNLGAGSHIVAIRDSNACLGPSQTQMIVIPTAINASITTTPASSSIAADGTMTVTVNGGTPGYSVTLNGGAPHTIAASGGSTTFTGLTSGGYNVVTTDANGCSLGIAEQLGSAPATTEVRLCSILPSIGTGGKTVFMVTLPKGPLKQPLTVFYTMSGTAIFGADYSLSPIVGRFIIPAGKTSATVTITALKNLARKTNRTAPMTIVNGPGYFTTTGFNTATVTIRR